MVFGVSEGVADESEWESEEEPLDSPEAAVIEMGDESFQEDGEVGSQPHDDSNSNPTTAKSPSPEEDLLRVGAEQSLRMMEVETSSPNQRDMRGPPKENFCDHYEGPNPRKEGPIPDEENGLSLQEDGTCVENGPAIDHHKDSHVDGPFGNGKPTNGELNNTNPALEGLKTKGPGPSRKRNVMDPFGKLGLSRFISQKNNKGTTKNQGRGSFDPSRSSQRVIMESGDGNRAGNDNFVQKGGGETIAEISGDVPLEEGLRIWDFGKNCN